MKKHIANKRTHLFTGICRGLYFFKRNSTLLLKDFSLSFLLWNLIALYIAIIFMFPIMIWNFVPPPRTKFFSLKLCKLLKRVILFIKRPASSSTIPYPKPIQAINKFEILNSNFIINQPDSLSTSIIDIHMDQFFLVWIL